MAFEGTCNWLGLEIFRPPLHAGGLVRVVLSFAPKFAAFEIFPAFSLCRWASDPTLALGCGGAFLGNVVTND